MREIPPPGWYADPQGHGLRWWDGAVWTDHRQARTPPAPPRRAGMGTGAKVALWLTLGGVVLLAGCGVLLVAIGSQGPAAPVEAEPQASDGADTPLAGIEQSIKPELRKQTNEALRDNGLPAKARVRELSCIRVKQSETEAKCFAVLTGTGPSRERSAINVTIDPDDGSYIWETAR